LLSRLFWEVYKKRFIVQAGLGKKQDVVSKIIRARRDRSVAKAMEYLPSKHKMMNSNPSTSSNGRGHRKLRKH
jgi:hypothetical protein